MRSFLYNLVTRLCVLYAMVSDWLFPRLANLLLASSVWVKIKVATIAMSLVVRIDPERVEQERQEIKETKSRNELSLMQAAIKIKEHALENGGWSDSHTEALNDVGTVLMNECDWGEERTHEYLAEILNGLPGLEWYFDEE